MKEKAKTIIIKKVKKGHEGHHGGSWKVAYADFVTAMMAFFLLMWLLSMVSPEKRAVLAMYFKHFSLFEKGGKSFMMEGGMKPVEKSGGQDYYETGLESSEGLTDQEQLKGKLAESVQEAGKTLQENLMIDVTEEGVRIQIIDRENNPIFLPGRAELTDKAKQLIRLVAGTIKGLPNEVVVEGHTDASGTKNGQVTNWELSAQRASSARRELEACGIDSNRIARVVGFADKALLVPDNPEDPRNRRISLLFLYSKQKVEPKDPTDWVWEMRN